MNKIHKLQTKINYSFHFRRMYVYNLPSYMVGICRIKINRRGVHQNEGSKCEQSNVGRYRFENVGTVFKERKKRGQRTFLFGITCILYTNAQIKRE